MMSRCTGLGDDFIDYYSDPANANYYPVTYDVAPDTSVLATYASTGVVPSGYILTSQGQLVLDTSSQPYVSTNAALDAQNQAVTNQLANSTSVSAARTSLDSANKTLAALTAAGANAAQIAVAASNAKAAQAAYTKMVAAVAGTACSSTIITGVCNSTLLIGGLVAAALLLAFGMKAK